MSTLFSSDASFSELVLHIFMSHSIVRQWLFQAQRPALRELVYSLTNLKIPLFIGIQLRQPNDTNSLIDYAGVMANYQEFNNCTLGFSFGYHGLSMACLGFWKLLHRRTADYGGRPVNRCSSCRFQDMGKRALSSLKFKWLDSGGVLIDMQAITFGGAESNYAVEARYMEY